MGDFLPAGEAGPGVGDFVLFGELMAKGCVWFEFGLGATEKLECERLLVIKSDSNPVDIRTVAPHRALAVGCPCPWGGAVKH